MIEPHSILLMLVHNPEVLKMLINSPYGTVKDTVARMMILQNMRQTLTEMLKQYWGIVSMRQNLASKLLRLWKRRRGGCAGRLFDDEILEVPLDLQSTLYQLEQTIHELHKQLLKLFEEIHQLQLAMLAIENVISEANQHLTQAILKSQLKTARKVMQLLGENDRLCLQYFIPKILDPNLSHLDINLILSDQQTTPGTEINEAQIVYLLNILLGVQSFSVAPGAWQIPDLSIASYTTIQETLATFRLNPIFNQIISCFNHHEEYCIQLHQEYQKEINLDLDRITGLQEQLDYHLAHINMLKTKLAECHSQYETLASHQLNFEQQHTPRRLWTLQNAYGFNHI